MRLLDRYLLRELLVPLGYCLGGFLIFWVAFDLITAGEELQRAKLTPLEVAEYYALRLPDFFSFIAPIGLLLALLYSLTNLARHNEITAMRAAGVSVWRLCLPYLGVGFFLSVVLSILSELIIPPCAVLAEQVLQRHQPVRAESGKQWVRPLAFANASQGRTWYAEAYNKETYQLLRPTVTWSLAGGARRIVRAGRGGRVGDQWVFFEVQETIYTNRADQIGMERRTNSLYLPEFTETPAQIESELKIGSLTGFQTARKLPLTVPEILNYIALHPVLTPGDHAKLFTKLHVRLAKPWTALIVVLIAVPFGAAGGRRNVAVGVASSVFICFAFHVVTEIGGALGTGGHIEPWLAAWAPNLVFGVAGLVLTLRMR